MQWVYYHFLLFNWSATKNFGYCEVIDEWQEIFLCWNGLLHTRSCPLPWVSKLYPMMGQSGVTQAWLPCLCRITQNGHLSSSVPQRIQWDLCCNCFLVQFSFSLIPHLSLISEHTITLLHTDILLIVYFPEILF